MSDSSRPVARLSKSRYISGKRCHLKLYYECFSRDLATPFLCDAPMMIGIGGAAAAEDELVTGFASLAEEIEEETYYHAR